MHNKQAKVIFIDNLKLSNTSHYSVAITTARTMNLNHKLAFYIGRALENEDIEWIWHGLEQNFFLTEISEWKILKFFQFEIKYTNAIDCHTKFWNNEFR